MDESKKDFFIELQDIILSIKEVVKKYDLEDEFICSIALGLIELDSTEVDDDGEFRANMNLMSYTEVEDDDELDDLLSYVTEVYQEQVRQEKKDSSSIDYWINLSRRDGDVN
jgi:hypothetical protein